MSSYNNRLNARTIIGTRGKKCRKPDGKNGLRRRLVRHKKTKLSRGWEWKP